VAVLVVIDLGDLAYRIVAVTATWEARDPSPVNEFVARYVPAGSAVVGPDEPFLFPVERGFSRYRTISPRSWADWARWVPDIEPAATLVARRIAVPPPRARFLIWHKDDPLPEGYECAASSPVATFEPAPPAAWMPRLLRDAVGPEPGYPAATLYALPAGCPAGYDPTRAPR
jgi:hypothetical protein